MLFNEHIDRNYQPLPEDRPGGFNWGGEDGQQQGPENNGEAMAQNAAEDIDNRDRPDQN